MMYAGQAVRLQALGDGVVELCFDQDGASVNTFSQAVLAELREALDQLKTEPALRGVLLSSGKDAFIVGADITGFLAAFAGPEARLLDSNARVTGLFSEIEDLPVPSVAAINGLALGGGLEIALACDFRVLASNARVGFPEVRLGIYPGWGGTVRLPRLIGVDNAVEWIASGKEQSAETARQTGLADAVVAPEQLREAALDLLHQAMAGQFDIQPRRQLKQAPLQLQPMEQLMAFESCKGVVAAQAGPHYPAPLAAVKAMQKAADAGRDQALAIEAEGFVRLAKTPVAANLVGLFLNDQLLKRQARHYQAAAREVHQAAVLGAGIMGGGIACQSASSGVPVLMKDLHEAALQQGLGEAARLLEKQVERGRLDTVGLAKALSSIQPTLSYGDFGRVDLVVEAVVENAGIKRQVLADVEASVGDSCILTSNTSTIAITQLAGALQRPENFCGMHFFNPVHRMPLVEVIRGPQSSEQTIATVVSYARQMGKTPIVVRDCPGFLVNRILFPYFAAFGQLLRQGIAFQRIDRLMEAFGWPMGPAWLLDVVGIDTAVHARDVMARGFPGRMGTDGAEAIDALLAAGRLGQKNARGFYAWRPGRGGRPEKAPDPAVEALLAVRSGEAVECADEEIVQRMLLPLCLEAVRCLEEDIAGSAAEVDMGLIYGLGFPAFRGGALRHIDSLGLAAFVALADRHAGCGPLYQPTEKLREMAARGQSFYGQLSEKSQ